jgi:hypothetical protein
MDALGLQSRGFFFGCHLLELCYTIHQHSFIRLKCNPWFISINPWFICSYINPLRSVMFLYVHINLPLPKIPKDPRSSNTPNPAPGYPQIYLWSHRPSPFFAPHPACNEHPDWGRSHGVGFSFHWLEILNPRGLVVVVVHGCFSHGFAAPLAISCNINIMLICWKCQKLETNSSPKPDCRARS